MDQIANYLKVRSNYVQPTKNQILIWALMVGFVIFLSLKNNGVFQVGAYWDDASYVVLAKSILLSPNYGHMSDPGSALTTRYPFGFPLLLASLVNFPNSFNAMKSISFIATLINMALLFWGWSYVCTGKSHWWSLAVIAVSCLSPLVIGHTGMVMSEPIFTTFMLLSLIMAERLVVKQQSLMIPILLGILLSYTIFIRTIGIFLIPAIFLTLIVRLRKKSVQPLLISITSGSALIVVILIFTNIRISDLWPKTYIDQNNKPESWGQSVPNELVPRFLDGLQAYLQFHVREVVIPIGGGEKEIALGKALGLSNMSALISIMIICIAAVGFGSAILGGTGLLPSILLFEVMYLPILFLWPWRGPRFLYPVQPFLIYQFLSGISFLVGLIPTFLKLKGIYRGVPQVMTSGVVGILIILCFAKSYSLDDSRLHLRDLEVGTVWLKENSDVSAIVLARNPDNVFIYSDRKTLDYPEAETRAYLKEFLQAKEVDYILLAPELQWRNDGQFAYDEYTEKKFVRLLRSLQEDKVLTSVFRSEADLVEVFQVVR